MSGAKGKVGFEASGFFVLRTPLLPFDEFLHWSEALQSTASSPEDADRLREAIAEDKAQLRRRLRDVLRRPEVREALFVASPDLDESVDAWQSDPESVRGQRIERALVRYFSRMTGRATPFGLLAGCSVGTIDARTSLAIGELASYQRHTRLDMEYLVALTDALGRDHAFRQGLHYRPNTSLYPAAGRAHYVETTFNKRVRAHKLVAIDSTEYLEDTLRRAQTGVRPSTLSAALVETHPHITPDEAQDYIRDLIDNQVLVPDLEPPVTGGDPLNTLLACLGAHPDSSPTTKLEQVRAELSAIDAAGVGASPQHYRTIAQVLEELPVKPELPRLFQTDMFKPMAEATLGGAPLREIVKGVELLHRLSGRRGTALKQFREAFVERFENREVPLVEALDDEGGVGFGSSREAAPLLEGLVLIVADDEQLTVPWDRRLGLLERKIFDAHRGGTYEITLTEDDLKLMESENPLPLPDAFSVTATIAAPSELALEKGHFLVVMDTVMGPSGARLLGRFCYADRTLEGYVAEHLRAEEALYPHAVFAEIVHLPQGRLGNVLFRPLAREYEIPYLGRSGAPLEKQIPINDLMVSVSEGRVTLRSRRLGREVIPRLTTAHNYNGAGNLGLYRFLCALQGQGTVSLAWDWGVLAALPFLPRVTHGRLVLSRARWNFSKKDLDFIQEARGADRFRAVQRLRFEHKLPRFVALVDADNKLPIDLDNVLSVDTFAELIKQRQFTQVVEMFLTGPDELCVRGPEGRFLHEIIVPFVQTRQPTRRAPPPEVQAEVRERTFPPGSEWLYLKLYTGNSTADQVLREVLRPLTQQAIQTGLIDRWFFIRYGDPRWHLRLRFHGDPDRLLSELLPALQTALSPLLADHRLWRIQLDTYEREIERYGGLQGVLCAEDMFHADCEAVLSIVESVPGDQGAMARWRLALRAIDLLLADFGLDSEAKRAVIKEARETFAQEYRGEKYLKRQLGDKYRQERENVASIIKAQPGDDGSLRPGLLALRLRSEQLAPIIARLQAYERSGELAKPITTLLPIYLHMHVNRIFRASQRSLELVIYDFLERYYESEIMQAKNQKKSFASEA